MLFRIRHSVSFVHVNNQLNLQITFYYFQVLCKERSVVREAYIDILYDSRLRRVNFIVEMAYQVHVFSAMLCYYCVIIDKN